MEDNRVMIAHAELIKRSTFIIQNRVDLLSQISESEFSNEEIAIRVYQTRSLMFYKRFLTYISREMSNNDPESAYFLILQTRTLMDIYSRFLHLEINLIDDKARSLVCIAVQLLAAHAAESRPTFNEVKAQYAEAIAKSPISEVEFDQYSFDWVRNNGLNFPSRSKILTEENVNRFAIDTKEQFKGQQLYKLYAAFSEYGHANPFYGNDQPHNEKYWVITVSIQMTAYLIELIDRRILKDPKKGDFRLWLKEVAKNENSFLLSWEKNRSRLKNNA